MPVYCPHPRELVIEPRCPHIESPAVEVSEFGVKFCFNTDYVSARSDFSGMVDNVVVTSKGLSCLPHDLVAAQHCGRQTTDEPLSKIQRLGDATDLLTPDVVDILQGGKIVVIEFKTTRSVGSLSGLWEEAANKYKAALERRGAANDISFFIVCVSPYRVHTNQVMTIEAATALGTALLYGHKLQALAAESGWKVESDKYDEKIRQEFLLNLMMLNLPENQVDIHGNDEPILITKSILKEWQDLDADPASDFFMANLKDAKRECVASCKHPAGETTSDFLTKRHDNDFVVYYDSLLESGSSMKPKTVISMPIAHVTPLAYYEGWNKQTHDLTKSMNLDSVYGRVWDLAFREARTSENYDEYSECTLRKQAMSEAKEEDIITEVPVHKTKRFMVDLELRLDERIELAKRGVEGKDLKMSREVQSHYEQTKEGMHPLIDVDDIGASFAAFKREWMEPYCSAPPVEKSVATLVAEADTLSRVSARGAVTSEGSHAENFIKAFTRTRLALALSFSDEVTEEVNISRMRFLKPGQFILKRLRHYPAFVLIKTTAIDKHVFFSVFVERKYFRGSLPLSEPWMDLGTGFATKFVSMDRHKITHRLYSTYKIASLLGLWKQQFEERLNKLTDYSDETILDHFWMSTLVFLEDKEKTSASLQQIRYAYMEMIKGGITLPHPSKILVKFPKIIRSRLLMWVIRRVEMCFRKMLESPVLFNRIVTSATSEESHDQTVGLLSWITMRPIPRVEIAINLSYLGTLHNKEEGSHMHGVLTIFEKLMTQELLMPDARVDYMLRSKEKVASKFKYHEFSASAVKAFATTAKNFLEKKYGNYADWATKSLSHSLLQKTWDGFATSKASTRLDGSISGYSRGKCVETILDVIDEINPENPQCYLYTKKLFDLCVKEGGARASLFKKLQIGGAREIFVLTMLTRVLVAFVETISRCICHELPNEMLTKGDQKARRSDSHYAKRRELFKKLKCITLISSDDAKTWAQQFVMPVFGVMLSVLVPAPFLEPCLAILNLITSKRLLLPPELLDLFCKHKDVRGMSDSVNHLKQEYLCPEGHKILVEHDSNLLKNRSNMMQGILHYTSSLLHACYLLSFEEFVEDFTKRCQSHTLGSLTTTKVSSDDSSVFLTICPSQEFQASPKRFIQWGTILLFLKARCYPLWCARQSYEKSTMASLNSIEEFNSLWFVSNTLISPSIRYVAQAVRTHVTNKFEHRLLTLSGLRQQVYENSGSTILTSIVQSCQLRAHYIALGLNVHRLWPDYVRLIREVPHICLGFFLKEPELTCGMFGVTHALYLACLKNKKVSGLTRKLLTTAYMDIAEVGHVTCSLEMNQLGTNKFKAMVKRLHLQADDVHTYFDNNPTLLLREARNYEEIRKQVELLAVDPALANAFTFLTDSALHAASSYVLHTPCVTVRKRILIHNLDRSFSESTVARKQSLLKTIDEVTRDIDEELSGIEVAWHFPLSTTYITVTNTIQQMGDTNFIRDRRRRSLFAIIPLHKYNEVFLATPQSVIKRLWFGEQSHGSQYQHEQTTHTLKQLLPWFSDNFTETVLQCPFQSAIGLVTFIKALMKPTMTIRTIAPTRLAPTTDESVALFVLKTAWPRYVVAPEAICAAPAEVEVGSAPRMRQKAVKLQTMLWLLNNWALHEHKIKSKILQHIFDQAEDIIKPEHAMIITEYSHLSPVEAKMAIFQLVVKHGFDDVTEVLHAARKGLTGGFIRRGKKEEDGEYTGAAIFSGSFNNVNFKAHIRGERLYYIAVEDPSKVDHLFTGFAEVMTGLGCSSCLGQRPNIPIISFRDVYKGTVAKIASENCVAVVRGSEIHGSSSRVKVKFSYSEDGVLRLRTKVAKPITVLSFYPAGVKQVCSSPPLKDMDEATKAWFSMQPLPTEVASKLVTHHTSPDANLSQVRRIKKEWIKTLLKQRAIHKGFICRDIDAFSKHLSLGLEHEDIPDSPEPAFLDYDEEFPTLGEPGPSGYVPPDRPTSPLYINVGVDDKGQFVTMEETAEIPSYTYEQIALVDEGEDDLDDMIAEMLGDEDDSEVEEEAEEGNVWCIWGTTDDLEDEVGYMLHDLARDPVSVAVRATGVGELPFWDHYLSSIRDNSSIQIRSYAMEGVFFQGCSPIVEEVARLFGAERASITPPHLTGEVHVREAKPSSSETLVIPSVLPE